MKSPILTVLFATIMGLGLWQCSTTIPTSQIDEKGIFAFSKASSGKTIATINGVDFQEGYLEMLSELNPGLKGQLENPVSKKKIVGDLINQQLLFQEAIKKGMHKDESVALKSMLNLQMIIAKSFFEEEVNKAIQDYYEKNKNEEFKKIPISQIGIHFLNNKELKDKVEVTEKHKQAALKKIKDIKVKLKSGEDFEKLAEKLSDDKRTAKRGGKAGRVAKNEKLYEKLGLEKIIDVAFQLKNNEVSDPIETSRGYYIIKVTGEPEILALDEVKLSLQTQLQRDVFETLITRIKKESKITYKDESFIPSETPEKIPPAAKNHPGHEHEKKAQELPEKKAKDPKDKQAS